MGKESYQGLPLFLDRYCTGPLQNLLGPAVKNRVAGISYGMLTDINSQSQQSHQDH